MTLIKPRTDETIFHPFFFLFSLTACPAYCLGGCRNSTDGTTQFRVAVSASPSDARSVSPSEGSRYEEGSTLDITATPKKGWRFDHWEGDYSGTNSTAQITVASDKNIKAVFAQKAYALETYVEGQGTIGEKELKSKSSEYTHGAVVELTATPQQGWRFTGWKGDLSGSENPKQLTVDQAKEVTAVFEKENYTLSVSTIGEGSVSQDPDQQSYVYGTKVTLTATSATGWAFVKWQGDLSGSDNPKQITVDTAMTVTAVFEKPAFALAKNGVTVICSDAAVGDSGKVGGVTYTKRSKDQITPENAEQTCTSSITDMSDMFYFKTNFNGDISSWDVSSVTDFSSMFEVAQKFNKDLSNWDVSSATNMNDMFNSAKVFNQDISGWDVSGVTDFSSMFYHAQSFNEDLNNWDVSASTNMQTMFRDAQAFNGNISSWNVSAVTSMVAMFQDALNFNQDLSSWCVSNIGSEPYNFATGSALNSNQLPKWGTCPQP